MHIAITGASGLIGSSLSTSLSADGHTVTALVRRDPESDGQRQWQPGQPLDPAVLEDVDAVVHLAGAGVGDKRWTQAYKETILRSRVDGTSTIATAIAAHSGRIRFVCGSAIGYYGDTGDTLTDESGPKGDGFLADVVDRWEGSAAPAVEAGSSTAFARAGLVVSRKGGAWQRLTPLFQAGLGGKLGSGSQWWSPISIQDEVSALTWLLHNDVSGPVNLVATAATNAEVTKVMGQILHRPTLLPVPGFAIKLAIGEFAQDTLQSQRIAAGVLQREGFVWQHPTLEQTLRAGMSA